MAQDREMREPETDDGIPEGWELDGLPLQVPDDDDALFALTLDVLRILRRVGGVVQIAAVRKEIAPGTKLYRTYEYIARWNSYSPPVKGDEPVPEPVLAEAGG
jgi:hypothetical protein